MVATNDSTTLQLRLDVPENAAMGTPQNLTVTAKGQSHRDDPAGRGHARQGSAGQAHHQGAASVAARHLQVELRIPDWKSKTTAAAISSSPRRPGAAEFRDELHRAIRQPGADLDSDRRRPVQDREAQGPAAEHHRRQPLSGFGQGFGRGRFGRHLGRAGDHRSAAAEHRRPRWRTSGRAEAGKETTIPIIVTNNGTAPADEIALSSSAPSGWKIEFEPKTLDGSRPERTRKPRCG